MLLLTRPGAGRDASRRSGGRLASKISVPLEELHGALVAPGGGERLERAEVLPLAGALVLLARVEPVPAGRELADHGYTAAGACPVRRKARIERTKLPMTKVRGTMGMIGKSGILFISCLARMPGR